MLKSLSLKNISFYTFIGCLESEKDRRNLVECDVTLRVDLPFSSSTSDDDLENTLDYRVIEETLLSIAAGRHFNMMESLGEAFLADMVHRWPQVRKAEIVLRKPQALPSGAVPEVTMVYPDEQ